MSLRSRITKLEAALADEDGGRIAFFGALNQAGPIFYDGKEFPDLATAQAACGNKINCLLPLKLELGEWTEAMKSYNNQTPATAGNK